MTEAAVVMTGTCRKNQTQVCPTAQQVDWADHEIGVIIHFDMQVFEPSYLFNRQWGYTPDPGIFNPTDLDTDQWIATAKAAGAKYAVLVAKHCSGFSLWPTQAHSYSVASSPWRGGKGDIVADFIQSCRKFGLKPGIYASTSCNAYMRATNPGKVLSGDPEFLKEYNLGRRQAVWAGEEEQRHYNWVVETQLTELWSRYGKLFEIWFDGGVLPPEEGGPDIVPIMRRLQPDAVVFGGPPGWPSLARFVGNERAEPADPFWNTTDNLAAFDGMTEVDGLGGSPDGKVWSCGEADMPNRCQIKAHQGGWFWHPGDDEHLYSLDHLVEHYFSSVGRNTNLLLGMVIDPRGLVPEADCKRFAEFGERVGSLFSGPVAKTAGNGPELTLKLPAGRMPTVLSLMEEIRDGERVHRFIVEARTTEGWIPIWSGINVGHKRLERFEPIQASELRLRVLEYAAEPRIREFSAWDVDPVNFSVPLDVVHRCKLTIRRDRGGSVAIACSNPGLFIRYTTDGSEPDASSLVYGAPFPLRDGGVVKAYAFVNERSRSETVCFVFGVDRSAWKVVSVSMESPFSNGGNACVTHLLSDDPLTYWHTYHNDKTQSAAPHEVVLDMGRTLDVGAFTFLPRGADGTPDEVEFDLSQDGIGWTLASANRFEDLKTNHGMRLIRLDKPMSGRYVRFVAKHVLDDEDYVVVAGIGVIEPAPTKKLIEM